jgi:hypothetical protein
MPTYTAAQQAALKSDYDALPPGSLLRTAVEDLLKLRNENRAACAPS